MRFKPGDKVKVIYNKNCGTVKGLGEEVEYIVIDRVFESSNSYGYNILDKNGKILSTCSHCLNDDDLAPYTSITNTIKTSMSNIIEKFKLLKIGEPQRSFVKAGIVTSDGKFTAEGKQLFDEFLMDKFAGEFKTEVVDKIIDADAIKS